MFPEVVSAYLDKRSISADLLVFMDFAESPRRWWSGRGWLTAGGHTWQGLGELIAIDGLQASGDANADATTFTLSGVDAALVTMAQAASARVKGRLVRVYIQFFHTGEGAAILSNLDEPQVIWTGRMDQMRYVAEGSARTIVLTAETRWTSRRRPPFGLLTDQDQKARFPGDRGLEQVADLTKKQARWPTV